MTTQRLTPEEQTLVLEWHRMHCSIADIARHIGAPKDTVRRVIQRGNAIMTPTDHVAELMSQGLTFTQIANQLNMTNDAVKSAFKRIKRALGPQAR